MENSTKTIVISKVEMTAYESGNQYKITGADGLKYKFYDKKKDGNPTVAFSQFQDMGLKIGSMCEIWYKEQEKEYQGKAYTDRVVASFREAKAMPTAPETITQGQIIPRQANYTVPKYESTEKDEKFWDKKAYKQCLWGYWLEKYNVPVGSKATELEEVDMNLVWQVFNQIEKDAEKRFATGWDKAVKTFGTDEVPLPDLPHDESEHFGIPF